MRKSLFKVCAVALMAGVMFFGGSKEAKATTTLNPNSTQTVKIKTLGGTKGDSTYINISNKSGKKVVLIDTGLNKAGGAMDSLTGTDAYNSSTKTITIDYLIITHPHSDHINGLKYMDETLAKTKGIKINVKNMYVNQIYYSNTDDFKTVLKNFCANSKINVSNLYYFGPKGVSESSTTKSYFKGLAVADANTVYCNSTKSISFGDSGCVMKVIPALKKYTSEDATTNVNNSSMFVTLEDNVDDVNDGVNSTKFKLIFSGDVLGIGLGDILNNSEYRTYFSKVVNGRTFERVYYKVSHHGKRSTDSYPTMKLRTYEESLFKNYTKPYAVIGTAWGTDTEGNKYFNTYKTHLLDKLSGLNILQKRSFN